MKREFNVVIERDSDGVLIASVPGLRGCHTQASSQDELLARIREAIELRSRVGSDPKGRGSDMAPTPCSLGLPCLRAIDDALSVDPDHVLLHFRRRALFKAWEGAALFAAGMHVEAWDSLDP